MKNQHNRNCFAFCRNNVISKSFPQQKQMRVFFLFTLFYFIIFLFSCQTDPCKDNPCLNGGICIDGDCFCPDGFGGEYCQDYPTIGSDPEEPCFLKNVKKNGILMREYNYDSDNNVKQKIIYDQGNPIGKTDYFFGNYLVPSTGEILENVLLYEKSYLNNILYFKYEFDYPSKDTIIGNQYGNGSSLNGDPIQHIYIYDSNNMCSYKELIFLNTDESFGGRWKIDYTDSNCSFEQKIFDENDDLVAIRTFEKDDQRNPHSFFQDPFNRGPFKVHNTLESANLNSVGNVESSGTASSSIEYNFNGYPTKFTWTTDNGNMDVWEYQYTCL
jgi:hypothetical protein